VFVCACALICICICVCVCINMYTHVYIYIYTRTHTRHTHIHVYKYVCVCVYIYIYVLDIYDCIYEYQTCGWLQNLAETSACVGLRMFACMYLRGHECVCARMRSHLFYTLRGLGVMLQAKGLHTTHLTIRTLHSFRFTLIEPYCVYARVGGVS